MKKRYSVAQMAKKLNKTRQGIHYKIKKGYLVAEKIGNTWFVEYDDKSEERTTCQN